MNVTCFFFIYSKNKRKLDKDDDATAGTSKKAKQEEETSAEINQLKEQMDTIYEYRDALKEKKKYELTPILRKNKQGDVLRLDPTLVLDHVADIMTFGSLKPCPKCNGQFIFKSGIGYQCLGDLNEFTKCMNVTENPERVPFKVPKDMKKEEPLYVYNSIFLFYIDYLTNITFVNNVNILYFFSCSVSYKFQPRTRIIQKDAPSVAPKKPKLTLNPLQDFGFLVACPADNVKEQEWKNKILQFGGKVLPKSIIKAAALICDEDEFAKKKSSMTKYAITKQMPVLKGEFVDAIKELNYNLRDEMNKYLISPWVTDVSNWLKEKNVDYEAEGKSRNEKGHGKYKYKQVAVRIFDHLFGKFRYAITVIKLISYSSLDFPKTIFIGF